MRQTTSNNHQDALEVLEKLQRAEAELAFIRAKYEQYAYSGAYQLRAGVIVVLVLLGIAGISFAAYAWLSAVLPPRPALGATVVLVACAACVLAIIIQARVAQRQAYRARLRDELELSREIERELRSAAAWLNKTLQRDVNSSDASYAR
jgi:hypothetical protein